jgi:predicted nucleic acid-binding protein
MKGYLIDTNVLSELRKPAPSEGVLGWVAVTSPELLFVSVLTLAELTRGAELLRRKSPRSASALDHWIAEMRRNFAARILSVNQEIAECWARLAPQQPLPVMDGLLAATAMVHDLTMVTRNTGDFERSGVRILNPFDF